MDIDLAYDAALDPSKWPGALADIADACGGSRGVLFTPAHGRPAERPERARVVRVGVAVSHVRCALHFDQ